MLIVTGIIEIDPEHVTSAQAAAVKMMEETRKEAGCLAYEFSQTIEAPHRLRVYEEWESEAALQAHFETRHMAAFREALGEIGLLSREIYKIEAGEKMPLG